MKRLTIALAALCFFAGMASPILAKGKKSSFRGRIGQAVRGAINRVQHHAKHHRSHHQHHGHHQHRVHHHHQGHYYRPNCHRVCGYQWSQFCYFQQHGCYGYYCPRASCWYYYYAPYRCFLPVSYMQQYSPAVNQITINNVNTNTNVAGTGNVTLPPGARPLPAGVTPPVAGAVPQAPGAAPQVPGTLPQMPIVQP